MYLSTKDHDQLRTIVMGFEIPFRTFISRRLTSIYLTEMEFIEALNNAILTPGLSDIFPSELGKIKANPTYYYNLLTDAVQASMEKCVYNDTNVPNMSTLIALYEIFRNDVDDFLSIFPEHELLLLQMEKLKYVRNKLDHPQSKTLQTEDMYPVLSFVNEANEAIFILDENCFWDKSQDEIEREVLTLDDYYLKSPYECNIEKEKKSIYRQLYNEYAFHNYFEYSRNSLTRRLVQEKMKVALKTKALYWGRLYYRALGLSISEVELVIKNEID